MAPKLASLNFAGTLCKSLILFINFYRCYLCRYSLVSQWEADLPVTSLPTENFHRAFESLENGLHKKRNKIYIDLKVFNHVTAPVRDVIRKSWEVSSDA